MRLHQKSPHGVSSRQLHVLGLHLPNAGNLRRAHHTPLSLSSLRHSHRFYDRPRGTSRWNLCWRKIEASMKPARACAALKYVAFAAVLVSFGADVSAQSASIVAAGDILAARYINHRNDYRPVCSTGPFKHVAQEIRRADIAFANLESPVLAEPAGPFRIKDTLTFRADPSYPALLAGAGFDVISIANNHAVDFGGRGVVQTHDALRSAGLVAVGGAKTTADAKRPAIIRRNGLGVAFLAYTVWSNGNPAADADGAVNQIEMYPLGKDGGRLVRALKRQPDIDHVVVSVHWGKEQHRHPSAYQRLIARRLVNAGASVIIGHHPHVLQDIETYKGSIIAYSLGNFVFDNPAPVQRKSALLHLELQKNAAPRAALTPIWIDRQGCPRRATRYQRAEIVKELRSLAPTIPIATPFDRSAPK